jgi:serine/threonine protein kinase
MTMMGAEAGLSQHSGLIGQILGEYRLRALIGEGGMADVYRADDLRLTREVAVKVLSGVLAIDPAYVARFRAEARRAAALNHPYVVPVYASGEAWVAGHRLLYLVMPLLHESLRDLLAREGRLQHEVAVRVALQVAEGLGAVHAMGLVHRDVKPENVLLDAEGRALLGDFGIARQLGASRKRIATLAATGLPVGTPEYMAPEQLKGSDVDQQADLYALGTVLYELLTDMAPFTGDTPYDVAAKVLHAPLTPPSTHVHTIPAALERVVLTAMARPPSARYATAADMAQALRQALAAPSLGIRTGISTQSIADQPTDIIDAVPERPARRPPRLGWTSRFGRVGHTIALTLRGRDRRARIVALLALTAVLVVTGAGVFLGARQLGSSGAPAGTPQVSFSAIPGTGGTPSITGNATPDGTPGTAHQATPGSASATLVITPMPLSLAPSAQDARVCVATQTITNHAGQQIGWAWERPAIPGVQVRLNGRAWTDWPTGISYLPAGGQDRLDVRGTCKPKARNYAVVVEDTLGGRYTFVMTVP